MNWFNKLGLMTIKEHKHILNKHLEFQKERLDKERYAQNRKILEECREKYIELQSQLDPLIKELSEFKASREKMDWIITISLEPSLAMKLRDPALVSHFNLREIIIKRFLNLIEDEMKKGLTEKMGWK